MKRIILIIITLTICIIAMNGFSSDIYAEEGEAYESQLGSEVDDVLSDYGVDYSYFDMTALSIDEFLSKLKESVTERINAPFRLLSSVLVIIIFASFMNNLGDGLAGKVSSAEIYGFICAASTAAVISGPLLEVYENTAEAMNRCGGFMTAFVPIYVGIIIVSGGMVSAQLYNGITLMAAEVIVQAAESLVMPLLSMMAALAVMGSIFPNSFIDTVTALIKKLVTLGLTLSLTLFSGFVSVKSTLGAKADGFAAKSVKLMMSGFIPVVGSAVSDAYSTVKGSFEVMRCTVGTAGTVGLVLLFLPPIIEILVFRVVMWIGASAAEMFSVPSASKLMKGLDNGLAIAMSILICFGLLFIISTAVLMKAS